MSICLRYAHDKEEAIEVVNDGFLKIFQHIDDFDTTRPFKAWLGRIMVNTSIDRLRSRKKIVFTNDLAIAEEPSIAAEAIDKLSYEELLYLIQTLPPTYKTVFNLFVIEGWQHQEIATLLGISEGTSKSNLFKAKKILQEKIEKLFALRKSKGIRYLTKVAL